MSISSLPICLPENPFAYTELRLQENTVQTLRLVNGDVTNNNSQTTCGCSARVYKDGQWGFSSSTEVDQAAISTVLNEAQKNAAFLASRQGDKSLQLSESQFESNNDLSSCKSPPTTKEQMHFLRALDKYIQDHCPGLQSRTVRFHLEDIEKRLVTSTGSKGYSLIPRSILHITLSIDNGNDEPIELTHSFSNRGQYQDNLTNPALFFADIDQLYQHLLKKREAIPAQAGFKEVILDSAITGILAHEAVGHPTEADLVLGGSVANKLINQQVASPIVNMVDFAHSYNGMLLPVPVFIDDEGTEAKDTVLIENGILKNFMTNRRFADLLGIPLTGNSRAFEFLDEPLVRMRNTAILPGNDKLTDMIASIEDGYYLLKTDGGQADFTSEFMFGITLGYEIKDGQLGRAIQDTTISGIGFDVLKTISMISDEMYWECSGYCGKKQIIPVACGGPAIKCKVQMGGE